MAGALPLLILSALVVGFGILPERLLALTQAAAVFSPIRPYTFIRSFREAQRRDRSSPQSAARHRLGRRQRQRLAAQSRSSASCSARWPCSSCASPMAAGDIYRRCSLPSCLLMLLFLKELALSAWKVAITVLSPDMKLKPGIFAFPLTVDRDFEITLLANLITLTPGTLSVDVSDDRRTLYVHALDCSDPEARPARYRQGFERKIMEAFR
jgi:multicomponent Na+:H+ antiporter subunit E